MNEGSELINTEAAARRIGVSVSTLELWRKKGAGPAWVRVGQKLVRYRSDAIDQYLARSTRDPAAQAARAAMPSLLGATA